jgi:hypothetical protein
MPRAIPSDPPARTIRAAQPGDEGFGAQRRLLKTLSPKTIEKAKD